MASVFPGGIDNFVDPLIGSPLNSPSHALQHQNVNDAVEKIETYALNLPRGIVAFGQATTNLSFDASEDLSITASTFTAVANRYYRITYFEPTLPQVQNNNQVIQRIRFTNTSGTQIQATIYTNTTAVAGATNSATLVWVGTFTAGSIIIIGSLQSPGAVVTASRSADRPAQITIEDIGKL